MGVTRESVAENAAMDNPAAATASCADQLESLNGERAPEPRGNQRGTTERGSPTRMPRTTKFPAEWQPIGLGAPASAVSALGARGENAEFGEPTRNQEGTPMPGGPMIDVISLSLQCQRL